MKLNQFLRERIAEDGGMLDCGLRDHDRSRRGDETPDCWERPFTDCDFRDKREWEAKRQILALHAPLDGEECDPSCGDIMTPCRTLATLALIYANHHDYRQEWAP